MCSSSRGFSLIELVVVAAILGLLLLVVAPQIDQISPHYRLRGAARDVASTIDWAQGEAVARGKSLAVRYDLQNRRYALVLPKGFNPEESDEESVIGWRTLPEGVEFDAIILQTNEPAADDPVDVKLHPLGMIGSHIVKLRTVRDGDDRLVAAVKFNALVGSGEFFEGEKAGEARFRELEGEQ